MKTLTCQQSRARTSIADLIPSEAPRLNRLTRKLSFFLVAVMSLGATTVSVADPTITTQPTNQIVSLAASTLFRVSATTANPPIAYQWKHSDTNTPAAFTNLPTATGSILRFTNVVTDQAGYYRAILANAGGDSVTSLVAELSIDPTFIQANQDRLGDGGFLLPGTVDGPAANWVDYDNDGWMDILYARGWDGSAPAPAPMYNEVYRNDRDGTFSRVTNALTSMAAFWANTYVPSAADIDDDGDLDLLMTKKAPGNPVLFVSQFSQRVADFTPVTLTDASGVCGSYLDYDSDGWVDAALVHLGDYGTPGNPGTNMLLHNVGGQLHAVTDTEFSTKGRWLISISCVDYDEDGDVDIVLPGVGDLSLAYQNPGDGNFVRNWDLNEVTGYANCWMGCWGDYNNDGHQDLFIPNYDTVPSILCRNSGHGVFGTDPAAPSLDPTQGPTGAGWVDYDNDGDLDLFVSHLSNQGCRLFNNDGSGAFTEVWVGSPTNPALGSSYGGMWADYNNDGFQDLLLWSNFQLSSHLFLNNLPQAGNMNHWLKLQLRGKASNPNGLGATIRVKATIGGRAVWQMRQFGAAQLPTDLMAHFGLGDATKVDLVRIEWPSGIKQELTGVPIDQTLPLTLTESQNPDPANPPQMTSKGQDTDRVFRATVTCPADKVLCVLQASVDLRLWTKVQVQTNAVGTPMEFVDPAAANSPARFYRVIVP